MSSSRHTQQPPEELERRGRIDAHKTFASPTKAPYARTLFDLICEQACARPEAPAIFDGDDVMTYSALVQRARKVASLLQRLGIERGDRVALLLDNRIAWLEVCFAASALGATLTPFSTFVKAGELAFLLADSNAKILLTADKVADQDFWAQLDSLLPELAETKPGTSLRSARFPDLQHVVSMADAAAPGMIRFAEADDCAPLGASPPGECASPVDDALILYTSGSTSLPKAVRLQHYAILENGFNIGERQGLRADDRVFLAPPLFWAYASANALPAAFTHGAALVLQRRFEPGEALVKIARHKCTAIYTLPVMTAALITHPSFTRESVQSLRTGLTIGSPQDVLDAALTLGAAEICNLYGSSETCGNCCVTDHSLPLEVRAHCSGQPLPGVRLRIVDPETGAVLPSESPGGVEVKGYLMAGYGGASAAQNEKAFTPDGYFRTGDTGKLTADGVFVFLGRSDEMIKRGGVNVSPAEVEAILLGHPAVSQAGVAGAPDARLGELIVAFVVPAASAALDLAELEAYCRSVASRYKVPDRIISVSALPTTTTGKLQRRELRERAVAALEASQT